MLIVTLTNGMVFDSEVAMTRDDLFIMLDDGVFNRDPIDRIIELSSGLLGRDVTAEIAKSMWEDLDANNRAPHHELQIWLEGHGHDCDHLGVEPDYDPRPMYLPPSHW